MYKKDFENLLKKEKLPKYFLFRSSSDFLNEFYSKLFIEKCQASEIIKFYYDEYNFEKICNLLAQNSLFNDKTLIHLKIDKTFPTKEAKKIVELCEKGENIFICELNDENSKVSADFVKAFKVNFVRFFQPNNDEEVYSLLAFYANYLKLPHEKEALVKLYNLQNDLTLAANEMNKFANLQVKLNEENLKNLVNPLNILTLNEFFDLVFELKDFRKALLSLEASPSYNELALINVFYSSFYKIFELYLNLRISPKVDMLKILGYKAPFHVENHLKQQAYKLNDEKIEKIFRALNKAEFAIKMKANINKSLKIAELILEIQKILSK